MSQFCLVVDAGHTRVKFAACQVISGNLLPTISQSAAFLYDEKINWALIASWFSQPDNLTSIMIGTNLDAANQVLAQWPTGLTPPFFFRDKSKIPVEVNVDAPEKVGIDRLLKAVAANLLRHADQPAITVGTGTAITIDFIDQNGVFQGGAILPGILMGAKSLHAETTTLPHVNVWELLKTEPNVLGKNTEQAIASGLYWGHLGGVREIITRYAEILQAECGIEPLVLLTGGASGILAPYLPNSRQEDEIPIRALAAIAGQVSKS